ncbi:12104_t:CDS:2, partial [Acaulospora morrowiae]
MNDAKLTSLETRTCQLLPAHEIGGPDTIDDLTTVGWSSDLWDDPCQSLLFGRTETHYFLRELDLGLDEDDFKILRKEKIDSMKRGPAMKLEKQAKIFKEQTRTLKKGKIEYSWLFPSQTRTLQFLGKVHIMLKCIGSVNWLRKTHGYEITGQWHLEQVCDDGDYRHLYCDLIIKKPDSSRLEALELLYTEQLHPQEIWIEHLSREDFVITNLYWPCEKLHEKGLNAIHFWHDKEFKNARMSARLWDIIGKFCEIIDESILSVVP